MVKVIGITMNDCPGVHVVETVDKVKLVPRVFAPFPLIPLTLIISSFFVGTRPPSLGHHSSGCHGAGSWWGNNPTRTSNPYSGSSYKLFASESFKKIRLGCFLWIV